MALAHTILVLLANTPRSGYDVSKCFDDSVGCFWKASQQQVYRELARMEQQGLVEFEAVPQEGKPDKKIYRVTPVGMQELSAWFTEPTDPAPIREDLLVRVMAGPYGPRELLVQEVHRRRQMHHDQLQRYREKEANYRAIAQPSPPLQFLYLTLRRGIRYETDWIEWCDEVLTILKESADPQEDASTAQSAL
ncbi:MAG: PadR family transcriptional regulator [Kaiparowitsia implicata GSE-PSE-MK54-09C]|jgi:DNA-binding PadR family transcriptional regulator|nr:PadR family transcriptional regulator [Kaiparowitsia implicata GSE-PSE-MK54-09C]